MLWSMVGAAEDKYLGPAGQFLRQNPGIAFSLAIGAAFVVKVLAVSRGNLQTASAISQHISVGQFAAGAAMVAAPTIFAYLNLRIAMELGEQMGRGWKLTPSLTRAVAGVSVLACIYSWTVAIALVIPILFFAFERGVPRLARTPALRRLRERLHRNNPTRVRDTSRDKRENDPAKAERITSSLGVLIVTLYAMTLLLSRQFWLPAERFEYRGQPVVGYVLAEQNSSVIVLTDKTRVLRRLDTADIQRRTFCQTEGLGSAGRSLISVVLRESSPSYKKCDE